MPVAKKPAKPVVPVVVKPSEELVTLQEIRDELAELISVDVDKIKDRLTELSDALKVVPTKITRNSVGLVTKIEKAVDNMTLEITYTRDSSNVITDVRPRIYEKGLKVP